MGQYGLNFSYDYSRFTNNYCMIFWNRASSKSDPTGLFINVDFEPMYGKCRISGMNTDNGLNLSLYIYSDGHIETHAGDYMEQQ
jgi:hypothetical protein